MNMNRLINMFVRQLMNIGISLASSRGAKKAGGARAGHNTGTSTKQAAKVARRTIR
jgi:hypothetical protein